MAKGMRKPPGTRFQSTLSEYRTGCVRNMRLLVVYFVIILCASVTGRSVWKRRWTPKWRKANQSFQQRISSKLPKMDSRIFRLPQNPEADMSTVELVQHRGYPVETHTVTTDDGYILEIHRIPSKTAAKPVFLQHGVFESSADWAMNPTKSALPFILADLGYDVWLGNNRGNTYSRRHVSLDPTSQEFWNFSWDQMGNYDIPASINYILSVTKQPKMAYIGHSLGSAIFFIAMIKHPELNDKIDTMIALGPASSTAHYSNYPVLLKPFVKQVQWLLKAIGTTVIFNSDPPIRQLTRAFCEQTYLEAISCRNLLMTITGFNIRNFNISMMPSVDGHAMAGTSVNTMVQFAQNYEAGQTFQAFDYGQQENLQRYGSSKPATYDLKQVTAPVNIFYSKNDKVIHYLDVLWLSSKLGNLKSLNLISDTKFNHMDYLWGINAKEVLYDQFIPLLPPPV